MPLDNLRTGMILFYITEPGSDSCKIRAFGIEHLILGIAWNGLGSSGLRQGGRGCKRPDWAGALHRVTYEERGIVI